MDDIRHKLFLHEPVSLDPEHDERQQAAVLVPLVADPEAPRLLLTERAHELSSHAGEVSFPGGKVDDTDASLEDAALRENFEELGIPPEDVDVISPLRPFISKHGLLVTPFVGLLPPHPTLSPNPAEIASIFEVPLKFFETATPIRIDNLDRHGEQQRIPAFDYRGYEIWGLTSMIIVELLRVLVHGGDADL